MVRQQYISCLAFCLGFSLVGCGGDSRGPLGTVSGTVKINGSPLPSGTVIFHGPKDQAASASIQADGTYKATDAPVGPNKITVTVPQAPAVKGAALPGTANAQVVAIPAKYGNMSDSGLQLEVKQGIQTFDIDLKK